MAALTNTSVKLPLPPPVFFRSTGLLFQLLHAKSGPQGRTNGGINFLQARYPTCSPN